jgi:hypothetical protein
MAIRSLRTRLGFFWLPIGATCASLGLIMPEAKPGEVQFKE